MSDVKIPEAWEDLAGMRERSVTRAAVDWADARLQFLSLGANHPEAKAYLTRMASAEDALCRLAIPEAFPTALSQPNDEGEGK